MAHDVQHAADVRNDIADAVLAQIDAGAGAAIIVLQDAASPPNEVATLTCSDPAGTVSAADLTFSSITDDTSATGGTATQGKVTDSDSNTCLTFTVGIGSTFDLDMDNNVIGAGATVSITSFVYTAPV